MIKETNSCQVCLTVLGYPATHFNFELRTLVYLCLRNLHLGECPQPPHTNMSRLVWNMICGEGQKGLPSIALLCMNMEFYRAKSHSKIPFLLSYFSAWTEFLYKSDSGTSEMFQQARALAVNACQPYTNPWHPQKGAKRKQTSQSLTSICTSWYAHTQAYIIVHICIYFIYSNKI